MKDEYESESNTYYLMINKPSYSGEPLTIGEQSFKTFYAEDGYRFLTGCVNKESPLLEFIEIIDQNNQKYTIDEFLDILESLKVLQN